MPDEQCRLFEQEIKGEDEYNESLKQSQIGATEEDIFNMEKPSNLMNRGLPGEGGQGRQAKEQNI